MDEIDYNFQYKNIQKKMNNRIKTKKIALDNFSNFFFNHIEKVIDRKKIKFER